MIHKYINLGNKDEALEFLEDFKNIKYVPFHVRITNSNIKELNKVIGRNVFKKDALYINSLSLWEIMQPIGGKGMHNYHGLTPEDVYNALSRLQYSKEVYASYLDRYIIITDVNIKDDVYIVIIVTPKSDVPSENLENIVSIVTIYPSNRKIKLDKQKQEKSSSMPKITTYIYQNQFLIYNLNSFETSPGLKHAEHATS